MRNLSPWKLFAIIAIVVIALVLALTLKRQSHTFWEGDSVKVLLDNPFSAAQALMEKSGHKTAVLKRWKEFNPQDDDKNQLLIIERQNLRTQQAHDQLLKWVGQGNHLVLPMESVYLTNAYFQLGGPKNEDEEEEDDSWARQPLTTTLGVVYLKRHADALDSDEQRIAREEMTEEDKRLGEKIVQKRDALKVQPIQNIDQLPPHPLCVKNAQVQIDARAQETNAKKMTMAEVLPDSKMTIAKLKESIPEDQLKDINRYPVTADYTVEAMRLQLIYCSENFTSVALPEKKNILLQLGNSQRRPLGYIGDKPALFEGKNTKGTQIIRIPYEKGTITIVPEEGLSFLLDPAPPTIDTGSIRQFDHAYFLAYISQGKTQVLFLSKAVDYNIKPPSPSLLKMLYHKAPELLACLILFSLLFIWMQVYRNGPVLAQMDIARRNLKEHFHAQGEFLRRHIDGRTIIRQMQEDIWQYVQRRVPNIRNQSIDIQKKELSRLTGLSESAFARLFMNVPERVNPTELMTYIIALQKIRNAL